ATWSMAVSPWFSSRWPLGSTTMRGARAAPLVVTRAYVKGAPRRGRSTLDPFSGLPVGTRPTDPTFQTVVDLGLRDVGVRRRLLPLALWMSRRAPVMVVRLSADGVHATAWALAAAGPATGTTPLGSRSRST